MCAHELGSLSSAIGYAFSDASLLRRALYHPSMVDNPGQRTAQSNQRLEFLGDAVLELVISEALYGRFAKLSEGELTRKRAGLVQESNLAAVAKRLRLGESIIMNRGEAQTGGREKPSILSDALEAVFGAVYLDGGYEAARDVILRLIDIDAAPVSGRDAKSALQELLQSRGRPSPVYMLLEESGPAHARFFVVQALVEDRPMGKGEGKSKKAAEQMAAEQTLKQFGAYP